MVKTTEHAEQVALFQWVDLNIKTYPQLENIFAIPNGGNRNAITGAMLKREGVRPGLPDIALMHSSNDCHGLFIELKRRGGKVSPAQSVWIDRLNQAGYLAVVCYSANEAIDVIIKYLQTA